MHVIYVTSLLFQTLNVTQYLTHHDVPLSFHLFISSPLSSPLNPPALLFSFDCSFLRVSPLTGPTFFAMEIALKHTRSFWKLQSQFHDMNVVLTESKRGRARVRGPWEWERFLEEMKSVRRNCDSRCAALWEKTFGCWSDSCQFPVTAHLQLLYSSNPVVLCRRKNSLYI